MWWDGECKKLKAKVREELRRWKEEEKKEERYLCKVIRKEYRDA